MSRVRAFLAIETTPELQRALAYEALRLRTCLGDQGSSWRWVPADQMHITLKFFGEIPQPSVRLIRETVTEAVQHLSPFALSIGAPGVFGRGRDLQTLWMGIKEGREVVLALAAALESSFEMAGFARESRTLHPHVTLARRRPSRERVPRPDFSTVAMPALAPMQVTRLTLFQSTLTPSGPIYKALEKVPLAV